MKVDSKQPQNSKQTIQIISRNSGQKSNDQQEASTLRTASMQILSVLDPRVQSAAEKVVVARRNIIKVRLAFKIPRGKPTINPTVEMTDERLEELDRAINQLQGEAKRDETIKRKATDQR